MEKQDRQEIVNNLCGEEGLKEDFIYLLKMGGLSEYEGKILKDKLSREIDSDYDLNDMFYAQYWIIHQIYHRLMEIEYLSFLVEFDDTIDYHICEDADDSLNYDFPDYHIKRYIANKGVLEFNKRKCPKTVDEAVDFLIKGLDKESVVFAKETGKGFFGNVAHFSLGMYARNNLGINSGINVPLLEDIKRRIGRRFLFADDYSGFLMDKVWERIQENYDEIIKTKEQEKN